MKEVCISLEDFLHLYAQVINGTWEEGTRAIKHLLERERERENVLRQSRTRSV